MENNQSVPIQPSLLEQVENGEIEAPDFPFYYCNEEESWVVSTEKCMLGAVIWNSYVVKMRQKPTKRSLLFRKGETTEGLEKLVGLVLMNTMIVLNLLSLIN